jgi:hypothetical protein
MRNRYGLDETREPWCFLSLAVEDTEGDDAPVGWALADGNAGQLVSTEHRTPASRGDAADVTVALSEALDARRDSNRTLVTPSEETIANLRQELVSCASIASPTLRGFAHIGLNDVLDEYFDGTSQLDLVRNEGGGSHTGGGTRYTVDMEDPVEAVELLWQVWTAVYQLIPVSACVGDQL